MHFKVRYLYPAINFSDLLLTISEIIDIPLIAAGGIASGKAMYAAMALGADGVQIGSRFAATVESSGHDKFKKAIVEAEEGETKLTLKQIVPVRLIKNKFFIRVQEMERAGATRDELYNLLGRGRAKLGMFEGNIKEGELEIGQVSGMLDSIVSVNQVVEKIVKDFNLVAAKMDGIIL